MKRRWSTRPRRFLGGGRMPGGRPRAREGSLSCGDSRGRPRPLVGPGGRPRCGGGTAGSVVSMVVVATMGRVDCAGGPRCGLVVFRVRHDDPPTSARQVAQPVALKEQGRWPLILRAARPHVDVEGNPNNPPWSAWRRWPQSGSQSLTNRSGHVRPLDAWNRKSSRHVSRGKSTSARTTYVTTGLPA